MKNLPFLTLASALLLSSCYSTLTVRVHSFDMAKMRGSAEYKQGSRQEELKKYQSMLETDFFPDLETQMSAILSAALNKFAAESKFARDKIAPTVKHVEPEIHTQLQDLKSAAIDVRKYLEAYLTIPNDTTERAYLKSYGNFVIVKGNFEKFTTLLGSEVASDEFSAYLTKMFKKNSNITFLTNTFGPSIADDNMASFIAKAPEPYWNKYKTDFYTDGEKLEKSSSNSSINVTKITSFIGNSDIAVKMDGPGNFIVKGVRLDADQAFKTSFKVLSQGIKYLTFAAGIPAPTTGSSGKSARISELESLDSNKLRSEVLNKQYQQLTDSFLKIVDAYKDDLTSPSSSKRKEAIIAVKSAFQYYQSQLPTQ